MKPPAASWPLEALPDDAEHDLVGHQLPCVHGGLGPPQVGTRSHRFPEQVARGYLGNAVIGHQPLGLGSLSGTRRA